MRPLLARPTLEILKNIRDEARGTNERLDKLTSRVDVLTNRVDVLTGRVDVPTDRFDVLTDRVEQVHQRQVDAELRVATALTALAGTVDGLREDLREDRILRGQVHDHERRITALEARAS